MPTEAELKYLIVPKTFSAEFSSPDELVAAAGSIPLESAAFFREILLREMIEPWERKQVDTYYDPVRPGVSLRYRRDFRDGKMTEKITVKKGSGDVRKEFEIWRSEESEGGDVQALADEMGFRYRPHIPDFQMVAEYLEALDRKFDVAKYMVCGEDEKVFYDFSLVSYFDGLCLPVFEAESNSGKIEDARGAAGRIGLTLGRKGYKLVKVPYSNEKIAEAAQRHYFKSPNLTFP